MTCSNSTSAPGASMTLEQFEAARATRPCRYCGRIGVEPQTNPANNGVFVYCPHCRWNHVWAGVMWLRQEHTKKREPYPETVNEVWEKGGGHCFICGYDRAALEAMGIRRDRHHTRRYAQSGHDEGYLIPLCSLCHEGATWIQRWADKFYGRKAGVRDDAA